MSEEKKNLLVVPTSRGRDGMSIKSAYHYTEKDYTVVCICPLSKGRPIIIVLFSLSPPPDALFAIASSKGPSSLGENLFAWPFLRVRNPSCILILNEHCFETDLQSRRVCMHRRDSDSSLLILIPIDTILLSVVHRVDDEGLQIERK